ncbi:MAG: hypothetical protein O8C66_13055 [Candidatus Methanoperedens sp.]|nr:hypothetical protein [Candidatus Methanoperedens sp.]MCZ7371428.1 hypothetical protein [Candidatus Methanoperedens sp.]
MKESKNKPSKFAGGWKMDEIELLKIKDELRESWKRWEFNRYRQPYSSPQG